MYRETSGNVELNQAAKSCSLGMSDVVPLNYTFCINIFQPRAINSSIVTAKIYRATVLLNSRNNDCNSHNLTTILKTHKARVQQRGAVGTFCNLISVLSSKISRQIMRICSDCPRYSTCSILLDSTLNALYGGNRNSFSTGLRLTLWCMKKSSRIENFQRVRSAGGSP